MKFKQSFKSTKASVKRAAVLAFTFAITGLNLQAKNYYFSSSTGNDSYTSTQAQSEATPWKSIAKLNSVFASIVAGDNIYFKRGDTFYGAIVISKSGTSTASITIGAYGTGAKPIISGLISLSSWSAVGNGVYQSYAPSVKSSVNMVTLNDIPQAVGRYPNIDDANGGFLSYESYSGTTSITDNQLTNTTNWTGAEVVIRKQNYALERCKIVNHLNTTITYAALPSINPTNNPKPTPITGTNGWGYFIQRDLRTLDKLGEWFYNTSTKNLQMYFGSNIPAAYKVEVSAIDTLVNLGKANYININNITFEGANAFSLFAADAGNIKIQSCDINSGGAKGIFFWGSGNVTVDGVNFNNNLSNAIDITGRYKNNVAVQNCNVSNTGMIPGMGSFWDDNDYKAIGISVYSGGVVEYNKIQNTGYVGVQFQGNNITIKNNFINNYDIVKDDGGGIYSYQTVVGPTYTGRVIKENIIMNGIGAKKGTTGAADVDGIFMDGATMDVDILDNSIANIGVNGIYCNNPNSIKIRGNTCFNNGCGIGITRYTYSVINDLSVTKNIFYSKTPDQASFEYVNTGLNLPTSLTLQQSMQQVGNVDSNYYSVTNATGFPYRYVAVSGGAWTFPKPMSFEKWKSYTGHERSAQTAPLMPSYKLNSLISANAVTNGGFTSNLTGVSIWSPNSNITYGWDNTSKINGGELKITPAVSSTDFTLLYGSVGAISSSKKYILRVTTVGSAEGGVLKAYVRKSSSPQNALAASQVVNFGTGKKVHEFLIDAPITEAAASFAIEVQQSSGTTYVDDIEFYEADATAVDIDTQVRFEYNATQAAKTISLDAQYIGTDNTIYNGSITLQPYTSKILFRNGAIVGTPVPVPVESSLTATAAAPAVNCFGSTTNVTVAATGGSAPYKGTGTYSVNGGSGSLKISVASPTKYSTLIYSTIGAVSSAKTYVLRFSSLSGVTGNLKAYLRQSTSPYASITSSFSQAFGTSRIDHEFTFQPTVSTSAASFVIDLPQYTAATYIDNIAFFEVSATGQLISDNLYDNGDFENGISGLSVWSLGNVHKAEWDVTSKISNTYYYPVTDNTGAISTAAVKISQPAATLTARATASSLIGGVATVTVSATGGTAPYTGTGTFLNVLPGTYNYWVTDAKGCRSLTAVTITLLGARGATTTTTGQTAARSATAAAAPVAETSAILTANAYPNPTTSNFNLNVSGGSTDMVNIVVAGIDGRTVYQTQGTTNRNYNFGNNLMPGVYFVKIVQGTSVQTIKVIKAK